MQYSVGGNKPLNIKPGRYKYSIQTTCKGTTLYPLPRREFQQSDTMSHHLIKCWIKTLEINL